MMLTIPDDHSFQKAIMFEFSATNNEEEYEALIWGLEMAMAMDVKRRKVHTDSQLAVC